MKSGKSIVEMAKELSRIKENARDFVVLTEKLRAEETASGVVLSFETPSRIKTITSAAGSEISVQEGDHQTFKLNRWSAGQVAGYTDIPRAYFDRLSIENPALIAENINHGLVKQSREGKRQGRPESRLLRTLD